MGRDADRRHRDGRSARAGVDWRRRCRERAVLCLGRDRDGAVAGSRHRRGSGVRGWPDTRLSGMASAWPAAGAAARVATDDSRAAWRGSSGCVGLRPDRARPDQLLSSCGGLEHVALAALYRATAVSAGCRHRDTGHGCAGERERNQRAGQLAACLRSRGVSCTWCRGSGLGDLCLEGLSRRRAGGRCLARQPVDHPVETGGGALPASLQARMASSGSDAAGVRCLRRGDRARRTPGAAAAGGPSDLCSILPV